jgi:hypothetical protein
MCKRLTVTAPGAAHVETNPTYRRRADFSHPGPVTKVPRHAGRCSSRQGTAFEITGERPWLHPCCSMHRRATLGLRRHELSRLLIVLKRQCARTLIDIHVDHFGPRRFGSRHLPRCYGAVATTSPTGAEQRAEISSRFYEARRRPRRCWENRSGPPRSRRSSSGRTS